jgi:Icc-related predicted phosphoesterase
MRLLALFDIHNNVSCVRKLREQETNRFGALVVAGDIGRQRAAEVLAILKTFACPIVFVNGNWDDGGEAAPLRNRWLKSAHLRVVRIGELNWSVGRPAAAPFEVHCRLPGGAARSGEPPPSRSSPCS